MFLQQTETNAHQYSAVLQAVWEGKKEKGENEGNVILFVLPRGDYTHRERHSL